MHTAEGDEMSEQTEAQRLAEKLESRQILNGDHGSPLTEAAAELRRLEAEVQALLATPPVLTRDLAEILGSTVPAVCAALVEAGRPPRSTNMAVSGEEALEVAQALRGAVPAGWKLVPVEPSAEWISRLESQQTGELEAVDADAIRQCIVELLAAAPQPAAQQDSSVNPDLRVWVLVDKAGVAQTWRSPSFTGPETDSTIDRFNRGFPSDAPFSSVMLAAPQPTQGEKQ
jgi:hypothetical protein